MEQTPHNDNLSPPTATPPLKKKKSNPHTLIQYQSAVTQNPFPSSSNIYFDKSMTHGNADTDIGCTAALVVESEEEKRKVVTLRERAYTNIIDRQLQISIP